MGQVYLAFDPALERQVALKLFTWPDAAELPRFRREVQVAARLSHPHIVTVYDVGLEHEPPYVVMEVLTGGTLESVLKVRALEVRPFAWRETFALLHPLCLALAHAHQAGITHRDVKPANILFSGDAAHTLKLADFGLAHRQGSEQLTQGGAIMGTLSYMSPEQANGRAVDAAGDVFAVGVILYEAIAGFNPLRGQSWSETLVNVSSYDPIDLTPLEGRVPPPVMAVMQRALAKDREYRYANGRLLEQEIAHILNQSPAAEPSLLTLTMPGPRLQIENVAGVILPPDAAEILQVMFAGYGRVTIKSELSGGRSGSRLFLVRPIRDDGTPELPAVVKMAPIHLIQREWRAYQDYVRAQLAGVAEIQGEPVLPPGTPPGKPSGAPSGAAWGGLRYPLVGGGDFAVESLHDYIRHAPLTDVRYVLEQRLFRRMGEKWRHNFAAAEFRLADSYDAVLPVNLLIQPAPVSPDSSAHLIWSGAPGDHTLVAGEMVQARGFVVTEVDEANRSLTLDRPMGGRPHFYPGYRLRLQPVTEGWPYHVGQLVEVEGMVTATRQELLQAQAQAAIGAEVDLTAVPHTLPNGWPNPLARLPAILAETMNVRTANLHGDFNLDNILVDPATREVYLIDFALARHDHVLHDLLRLEKDVITRLLPEALAVAGLPMTAVDQFYRWLHQAMRQARPSALPPLPHPALEKPLTLVLIIRQTARHLLFDPQQWREYEQGLTLYLLGALKFRDLDSRARAAAFWGAAAVQQQLDEPAAELVTLYPERARPEASRRWWLWGMGVLVVLATAVFLILWQQRSQSAQVGPPLATIVSFEGVVEVKANGGNELQAASFGMPLFAGDVLITYAGATAQLFCHNGLVLELPSESIRPVQCQESESDLVVGRLDTAVEEGVATPTLAEQEAAIREQGLDETAEAFLLAQLYEQNGLTTAAIAQLERVTANSTNVSPAVWRRLGDLYLADGSAEEAEASYQMATRVAIAQVATATNTPSPTATPAPTDTPAPTATITPTATAVLLPTPDLPVGLGTAVPQPLAPITPANADQVVALARWQVSWLSEIACSPDGQTVAVGSSRGVPLVDSQRMQEFAFLPAPAYINTVAFSPDGLKLAAGSNDTTIQLWRMTDYQLQGSADAHTDGVWKLTFSPDGEWIASASLDQRIMLWRVDDMGLEATFSDHGGPVRSVAFSPNGQLLASASDDGAVRIWRIGENTPLHVLPAHTDKVRSVAFSPNGELLASASDDGTIRLWDVEDATEIRALPGHDRPVFSVAFAPDGQTVASGSADKTIRLWRVADGQLLQTLPVPDSWVFTVEFCDDGRLLSSGSEDGVVTLWGIPP